MEHFFQNYYSKSKTKDSNTQELGHIRLALLRCTKLTLTVNSLVNLKSSLNEFRSHFFE